ncbi:TPA: hypothetical protein EYP44_01370 [Candidatus Bathyarchaeota archaeon]|nr:hypothetical protein [Candidatus Bathyarchaeota archaeon]
MADKRVGVFLFLAISLVVMAPLYSPPEALAAPKKGTSITCEVSPGEVTYGESVTISGRLTDAETGEGLRRMIHVSYSIDDGKTWRELKIGLGKDIWTDEDGHYGPFKWIGIDHLPHPYLVKAYWDGDEEYEAAESPLRTLGVELPPDVPLEIINVGTYVLDDDYYVAGEVKNIGTTNLDSVGVKIGIVYYDAAGAIISVTLSFTGTRGIEMLTPEQKAPFEFEKEGAPEIDSHQVFIGSYDATAWVPYREFEIISHRRYSDDQGRLHVEGEVRNTGDMDATFVDVVVTFYGSEGKVVAFESGFTDPIDLGAGQTGTFHVYLWKDGSRSAMVADYSLQVQCFEKTKGPSSLTCSVSPEAIVLGEVVTVSGSLSPTLEGRMVTLTYTKPDGSTDSDSTWTDGDGRFEKAYEPDQVGTWSVRASWAGDWDHEGAESEAAPFAVEEDAVPPVIADVRRSPEVPDDGEPVAVTALVTDAETGVASVTLEYSVGDGPWEAVPMTRGTGDEWSGTIPGCRADTVVRYRVVAEDRAGNVAVEDRAGEYYSYTVVPEFATWAMLLAALSPLVVGLKRGALRHG